MRWRIALRTGLVVATLVGVLVALYQRELFETRVRVVVPGRLIRGAWQGARPLERIIEREQVKTIVTLTAINRDDPKYVTQAEVVRRTGVDWVIVPLRGSTATLEQMAEAADLLADPSRQPVFFHCVGGHHRTGLVHAAYRIRHQGWSADQAWSELESLPWTGTQRDARDHALIEAFAQAEHARQRPTRSRISDESASTRPAEVDPMVRGDGRSPGDPGRRAGRLPAGHG